MSFAMFAAPIEGDDYIPSTNVNKKRQQNTGNKTQKQRGDSEKVNSVLQSIHNLPSPADDGGLSDFAPIPPPSSMGVENTRIRDSAIRAPPPSSANPPKDYYSRFMPPGYKSDESFSNPSMLPTPSPVTAYQQHQPAFQSRDDILLTKLNYMINLLEQQQDERTNNVTEEVVLYIFLGIFIIFVIDSFVRVGKYKR